MYEIRAIEHNGEVRAKTFARTRAEAATKARALARAYQCAVKVWRDGRYAFAVLAPLTQRLRK